MNKVIGYYLNSGVQALNPTSSDYVQIELLGPSAKKKNAIALVSTSVYKDILKFKWYLGKSGYPVAYESVDKKIKFNVGFQMHKIIMGRYEGHVIDHINRVKLDNRYSNLRICTPKQNSYNRSRPKNAKNKYKGVRKQNKTKWMATISKDGKKHEIKDIATEKEAAKMYDIMAEELFGKFAGKNFD